MDAPTPTLVLPLPRWAFLGAVLVLAAFLLNPALSLAREWHGPLHLRLLALLLLVLAFIFGSLVAIGSVASRCWGELRIEGDRLLLKPALSVPRGVLWSYGPGLAKAYREGHLELPVAQASLEWVGRTLLLHGHPEVEVRLGRGTRAEGIAQWLQNHGLPTPVGR